MAARRAHEKEIAEEEAERRAAIRREMERPRPSAFAFPGWREQLHTGWPQHGKLGLPEPLAARERRRIAHQKKLTQIEHQIFRNREKVDNLRDAHKMKAAHKLSGRLKQHEVCRARTR